MRYKIELLGQRDCLDFCQKAQNVIGEVSLISQGGKYRVNAKSIMGVITMAAGYNANLTLQADGPDENDAIATISALFENKFEEE